MITIALVTIPPLTLAAVLFIAVGTSRWVVAAALAAVVAFPLSFFAHEFGHAAVALAISPRQGGGAVFGVGSFARAFVVRWRAAVCGDALVALAGPLAGATCVVITLLPGPGFLVRFPLSVFYLIHLASLMPSQADGRQLASYMKGSGPDAERS